MPQILSDRGAVRIVALLAATVATCLVVLASAGAALAAPMGGAIFTTDSSCTGANTNIFATKGDVSLDGGPASPNALGLPDGSYYVKVTEPNGTLLGSTATASVIVTVGEFFTCYQLDAILAKASDATPGYDDTSNPGGEYKVWLSADPAFPNSTTKTDDFKVRQTAPQGGTLNVNRFYDANANGIDDDGQAITGWKVRIQDNIDYIRFTPVSILVDAPDQYTITEFAPVEANWVQTTTNPVVIDLAAGGEQTVAFGNVCLGAGGGLTLGFWSNKNGQALTGTDDRALLSALNLRNAGGSAYDPATNASLKSWLLGASATNMAYMRSAQLAAMELNVFNGFVSGAALVYTPALGFKTVASLMDDANTALGLNGSTVAAGADRTAQEALKNALDLANNNKNFVQATPCAFSFAE